MSDGMFEDLAGAAVGLLGVAIMVDVAGKAMKIADKIPKPKIKKGEKIEW